MPTPPPTPPDAARARPRRDPALAREQAAFAPSVSLAGLLAAALAVVPLAGWGAGWPPLASYLRGWPVVSPFTALALLAAAAALLVSAAARQPVRRAANAAAGALLIGVALLPLLLPVVLPDVLPPAPAAELVERWTSAPGVMLRVPPAPPTAFALAFMGTALLLLAAGGATAVRLAWVAAGAAALVALLTAGVAPPESALPAPTSPLAVDVVGPVAPMPPPVAAVVLVLASAVLLVRTPAGGWWIPGTGAATRLVRLMAPALLVVPPSLVWVSELLVRRRVATQETIVPLLAAALVVSLALLVALAARRVAHSAEAERLRGQRRAERQLRRGTEQAAEHADRTVRVASERYRAHLRGILDVAPAPFLALDRAGYVAYVNAAAAELLALDAEDAAGRPVWEVWPDLGEELRAALADVGGRGQLRRTLVSHTSGRAFEVRGYPDETGAALFVRELDDVAARR